MYHVTNSGVTGGAGVWGVVTLKCFILTHYSVFNGIFARSVGFLNMKLCIFLKMHMVLSLDNFNITYNLKQRAQARLGRSAPCLGLIVYFDSNVQYRLNSLITF